MPEDELVEGMIQKCIMHCERGEYEKGLECFEGVTDFKEDALRAWYLKGLCLYKLERFKEAEEALRKALELDARQPQAWHMHGLALYKQGEFEKAADSFLEAAELEKTNPDHTFMAAVCYALLGRRQEAENTSRIACIANPRRTMELLQIFFETAYIPLSKKSALEKLEIQKNLNALRAEMEGILRSKEK